MKPTNLLPPTCKCGAQWVFRIVYRDNGTFIRAICENPKCTALPVEAQITDEQAEELLSEG